MREPVLPVGAVRLGGFGGVQGLREWMSDNKIGIVLDATHPFAGGMTANAAQAAGQLGLPVLHLRRPGWTEQAGDRWIRVPNLTVAAETIAGLGDRVFLTVGRQGVAAFAASKQWFLIRAIDSPEAAVPARHEVLLARGPFELADEITLLTSRGIDVLVTKDSGGALTEAKLAAARALGLPVVMIDRPPLPSGAEQVETVAAAWDWVLAHA